MSQLEVSLRDAGLLDDVLEGCAETGLSVLDYLHCKLDRPRAEGNVSGLQKTMNKWEENPRSFSMAL